MGRGEGGKPQAEKVRSDSVLVVAQTQMRKREAGKTKENKIECWSTKMLEGRGNKQENEEWMQWRSISQDGTNELWKEWCANMEEDTLEKYENEEAKKGAHKGR